ncbi:MAG: hypothetical protein HXM00_01335 [[Eubacterium] sulci]|jgi:hypothetical protein|nr:hypothetical protein [[Eubacterium] sulci]MBF1146722.1 hypothetical protein [[Eubacterium] sulci]MBF1150456.1 hypothetical protein [[Eubacterium] sulci]MBF1157595.1 hypothetical protein [[Eubacterium] sulci]MBF1162340.1 hypothetical protein [[Eubacterium] sulci]
MDLKPLMQFATDHQKTILMIYILIFIVSALNFVCIIVASKRAGSFNPASPILAITNAFLAMASTLLLALCVLFLDTSKTLYDSFDYLVSGVLLPITIVIDVLGIVGIFVLAFVVIHYRRKV